MRRKNVNEVYIKDCISKAFHHLCQTRQYDQISIKDICLTAGIGRSTYYHYFPGERGKHDMILYHLFRSWEKYAESHPEEISQSVTDALSRYIYQEKEVFLWLYDNHLLELLFDVFYISTGPQDGEIPVFAYRKAFLAGGIYGIVYEWCKRRFDVTAEELIQLSKI